MRGVFGRPVFHKMAGPYALEPHGHGAPMKHPWGPMGPKSPMGPPGGLRPIK